MTFVGKVTNTAQLGDIVAPDTLELPKIMGEKLANKYRHVAIEANIYGNRDYTSFHL